MQYKIGNRNNSLEGYQIRKILCSLRKLAFRRASLNLDLHRKDFGTLTPGFSEKPWNRYLLDILHWGYF